MVTRKTRIPDEEHTLLEGILEYCQLRHVRANHQRPCRTQQGWRTAIEGDEGFFDLTIIGPGGVIFAELKRRQGAKHSDEQKAWAEMARRAGLHFEAQRFRVVLWTFDNWPNEIKTAIDVIAKPSPFAATIAKGEWARVLNADGEPVAVLDLGAQQPGVS